MLIYSCSSELTVLAFWFDGTEIFVAEVVTERVVSLYFVSGAATMIVFRTCCVFYSCFVCRCFLSLSPLFYAFVLLMIVLQLKNTIKQGRILKHESQQKENINHLAIVDF